MDIKEIVTKIVNAVKSDKSLLTKLQSDPVKTIESVTGIDVPDEAVEKVIAGVKEQIGAGLGDLGSIAQAAGGILGGAADTAAETAKEAADTAKDAAEEAAGGIGGVLGKGLDALKKIF